MNVAVVIMAGGAGTRFWPLSTEERPKQFLRLLGSRSLLQDAYARARLVAEAERILVLTAEAFVPRVKDDLPELPPENVIGEPCRRDTAAAVALGAAVLNERHGNPVMVVLTADHRIAPEDDFERDLDAAAYAAEQGGALYTLGVRPRWAATEYGYLELGEETRADGPPAGARDSRSRQYEVVRFREKPDPVTAEQYYRSGRFLWNSGMFVWSVSAITDELRRQLPGHVEAVWPAVRGGVVSGDVLRQAFASLPSVSIDYGVMEGAARVRTIEASFEWDDLGGWPALAPFLAEDGRGNRHRGTIVVRDATRNVVFTEAADEVVALLGVDDLIVVRSGPRTLVARKGRSEEIKRIAEALRGQEEDGGT